MYDGSDRFESNAGRLRSTLARRSQLQETALQKIRIGSYAQLRVRSRAILQKTADGRSRKIKRFDRVTAE